MRSAGIMILVLPFLLEACATRPETPVVEEQPAQVQVEEGDTVKLAALTFDDGPDVVMTTRVLDRLEEYGVVASFFVVGQRINATTAPVLQRAVALGCEINNHSWAYSSMNTMTDDQVRNSVSRTTAAIEEYAGVSPAFFRPPNLAKSDTMYAAIDLPFAEGILAMDWAGQNTSAEDRARNVLNQVRDGAIILMHDTQPEPHPTPEALDILIPELRSRGYEFVTLTELFERKGVDPNSRPVWQIVN
jgi:peptidoglycan/xylan/chitin deacetylase (PgdA/CDA1 family)